MTIGLQEITTTSKCKRIRGLPKTLQGRYPARPPEGIPTAALSSLELSFEYDTNDEKLEQMTMTFDRKSRNKVCSIPTIKKDPCYAAWEENYDPEAEMSIDGEGSVFDIGLFDAIGEENGSVDPEAMSMSIEKGSTLDTGLFDTESEPNLNHDLSKRETSSINMEPYYTVGDPEENDPKESRSISISEGSIFEEIERLGTTDSEDQFQLHDSPWEENSSSQELYQLLDVAFKRLITPALPRLPAAEGIKISNSGSLNSLSEIAPVVFSLGYLDVSGETLKECYDARTNYTNEHLL